MVAREYIVLIFISCIVYSCSESYQQRSKEESAMVYLPCSRQEHKIVAKYDMERVLGADIPMYQLTVEDTVLVVTLDFDRKRALQKKWHIPISNPNYEGVMEFIRNQRRLHVRGIISKEAIEKEELFTVRNDRYNQLYEMRLYKERQEVVIYCHCPFF